jgi:hypothetical protein
MDRTEASLLRSFVRRADALPLDGDPVAWHNRMAGLIAEHHAAAYFAATRRTDLDAAGRALLTRQIGEQIDYLNGFTDDILAGRYRDSPAALRARAALYAGSIRATYAHARWGAWDLPFVPGDGSSECLGNCTCSIQVRDEGDGFGVLIWTLGGTERHCATCPGRAGEHPVRRKRADV